MNYDYTTIRREMERSAARLCRLYSDTALDHASPQAESQALFNAHAKLCAALHELENARQAQFGTVA